MGKMISHSAVDTVQTCGLKYDLHYNRRLRSKWSPSPLLFGGAIDDGLNTLIALHGKKDAIEKAIDQFESSWEVQKINHKEVELMTNIWVEYKNYDYDWDLIDEFEYDTLDETAKELGFKGKIEVIYDTIKKKYNMWKVGKGFPQRAALKKLTINERKFFNAVHWCCCRHRGILFLKAYYEQIYPLIKKVHGVQKKIKLNNNVGDEILGYIDLMIEWKKGVFDRHGNPAKGLYVMDNKTASSPMYYPPNCVVTSKQLALYCHMEEMDQAGFCVMYKKIEKNVTKICSKCGWEKPDESRVRKCDNEVKGKRCGAKFDEDIELGVKIDLILDTIPYSTQELVMTTMDQALKEVKEEEFAPRLTGCETKFGKCQYFEHCWLGKDFKDMDMEEVKSSRKKK